jgi:hypothetical protein
MTGRTPLILPDPGCSFGYPLGQVAELLSDRLGEFWVWMVGRKLRHCFGTKQSPAHGPVVYPVDLARFLEEVAA